MIAGHGTWLSPNNHPSYTGAIPNTPASPTLVPGSDRSKFNVEVLDACTLNSVLRALQGDYGFTAGRGGLGDR